MSRSNEEYLRENFDKVCRFCMKFSEHKNNFEQLIQNKLHSAFINQFGLQLSKCDDLPKVVCPSCFNCLTTYLEFHITSLDSYKSLSNTHIGIKSEKLDIESVWTADFLPKLEPDDDVASDTEKLESPTCSKSTNQQSIAADPYEDQKLTKKLESSEDRLCNICGKIVRRSNMVRHMEIHGSKMYFCDLCGHSVVSRCNLIHHMHTHRLKGTKNFVCSICGNRFVTKETLRKHMTQHLAKDKFRCDQCSKGFCRESQRKMHIRIVHQKIASHPCNFCDKKFYQASHRNKHIKDKHIDPPKPRPVCNVCKKSFKTEKFLELHIQARHQKGKKKIACDMCNGTFSRPSGLSNHMRKHGKAIGKSMDLLAGPDKRN